MLARLGAVADTHPAPLLFATVSGAHLYGFASPDSDFDLRGVHLLPAADVVGLMTGPETIERTADDDGFELDLVTHDAARLSWIDDLIARKVNGTEKETLTDDDADFHRREVERLTAELEAAATVSPLPEVPTAGAALHDLLVRLRLGMGKR